MLMGLSALTISVAVIIAFNQFVDQAAIASFNTHISLSVTTLMPYMISALVAAITAVAIIFGPSSRVLQDFVGKIQPLHLLVDDRQ